MPVRKSNSTALVPIKAEPIEVKQIDDPTKIAYRTGQAELDRRALEWENDPRLGDLTRELALNRVYCEQAAQREDWPVYVMLQKQIADTTAKMAEQRFAHGLLLPLESLRAFFDKFAEVFLEENAIRPRNADEVVCRLAARLPEVIAVMTDANGDSIKQIVRREQKQKRVHPER